MSITDWLKQLYHRSSLQTLKQYEAVCSCACQIIDKGKGWEDYARSSWDFDVRSSFYAWRSFNAKSIYIHV
jgi:hypothetical protein